MARIAPSMRANVRCLLLFSKSWNYKKNNVIMISKITSNNSLKQSIDKVLCAKVQKHLETGITRYDPGGLKHPPPSPTSLQNICTHGFNFRTTLLCVGDYSQKTPSHKILSVGQDLAVSGVSKFKVNVIFIIFCESNIILK